LLYHCLNVDNRLRFEVLDVEIIKNLNLLCIFCINIHSWELEIIIDNWVPLWWVHSWEIVGVVLFNVIHSWDFVISDETTVTIGKRQQLGLIVRKSFNSSDYKVGCWEYIPAVARDLLASIKRHKLMATLNVATGPKGDRSPGSGFLAVAWILLLVNLAVAAERQRQVLLEAECLAGHYSLATDGVRDSTFRRENAYHLRAK